MVPLDLPSLPPSASCILLTQHRSGDMQGPGWRGPVLQVCPPSAPSTYTMGHVGAGGWGCVLAQPLLQCRLFLKASSEGTTQDILLMCLGLCCQEEAGEAPGSTWQRRPSAGDILVLGCLCCELIDYGAVLTLNVAPGENPHLVLNVCCFPVPSLSLSLP